MKTYQSFHILCKCGCIIRRDGLSKHQQKLKHIRLIEEKHLIDEMWAERVFNRLQSEE